MGSDREMSKLSFLDAVEARAKANEREQIAQMVEKLFIDWATSMERPYDNEPEFSVASKAATDLQLLAAEIRKRGQDE